MPLFLKNLKEAQRSAEMVEIRADYIKGFKAENVKSIKPLSKVATIFTCRNIKEGGKFSGSYAEQAEIFKAAFKAGFDYVDIAGESRFMGEIKGEYKKKLLLSHHDFKGTSSSIELMGRIERMQEFSPAIIKIATMIKSTKDIFTLIEVLKQKRGRGKLVVIGMGDAGKITRILFPILGSYLTYAGITLPGILTADQFKTVYNFL